MWVVRIQVVKTNERICHEFDDYNEACRFVSYLTFAPVERIKRCMRAMQSYTISRSGLFVRIERG